MKVAVILLMVLLSAAIFGCSAEGQIEKDPATQQEANIVSSPLAGTCATGKSCTVPSCGQYVDSNKDSACDRGVLQ